jgi:hypothetical protein
MADKAEPNITKSAEEPELQKAVDEAEEQGFWGHAVDPTPNERYSLESDDWRTPETDRQTAEEVGGRFHHRWDSAAKDDK